VFILFVAIFSTAGQEFSGDLRGGESRLLSAKKIMHKLQKITYIAQQ
jgi:hypothetical protein